MLVEIYHADPPDFDCERDAREFPKGTPRFSRSVGKTSRATPLTESS
jgi:hypothetical protein